MLQFVTVILFRYGTPFSVFSLPSGTQILPPWARRGDRFSKLRIFATRNYRPPNWNSNERAVTFLLTQQQAELNGTGSGLNGNNPHYNGMEQTVHRLVDHKLKTKKAHSPNWGVGSILTLVFQEVIDIPTKLITAHHFGNRQSGVCVLANRSGLD